MAVAPLLSAACLLGLAVGCGADLGTCEDDLAHTVVYDEDGVPAYAGQALLHASCGAGAFCHTAGIDPASRLGAPFGLELQIGIATSGYGAAEDESARLAAGQASAFHSRGMIWDSVASGAMPPIGGATDIAFSAAPHYAYADATPLPGLDTERGREVLRGWLACGLPVVERTTYRPDGLPTTIGDVVARGPVQPPMPTFTDLYARALSPRCGVTCHGPAVPAQLELAVLDLSEPTGAYAALVDARAVGADCEGEGGVLVVPGNPDESLLMAKLEGRPGTCGDPMPAGTRLPPETLDAFRRWIADGALDN